jgi:hypothetical protein
MRLLVVLANDPATQLTVLRLADWCMATLRSHLGNSSPGGGDFLPDAHDVRVGAAVHATPTGIGERPAVKDRSSTRATRVGRAVLDVGGRR